MALDDKLRVKCAGLSSEELYFAQQEMEALKELRECAQREADEQYNEDHKYHCFRCGTQTLVEVDHGGMKIDVCVNEGCGAVHLDPGELEALSKHEDRGVAQKVSIAVLGIFK